MITKEQLEDHYITQNKSVRQVMKDLNISKTKFYNLLEQYQIVKSKELMTERKSKTWQDKDTPRNIDSFTKEYIQDLYITQDLSEEQLKEVLGVSKGSIRRLLAKFDLHKSKEQINQKISRINRAVLSREDVKDKRKKTMLERYGVEHASQAEHVKDIVKSKFASGETQEKVRKTMLERYGVENYTQSQEYVERSKQTYLERYGVENYTQSQEYRDKVAAKLPETLKKVYQTRKKNHTFNSSQPEEDLYQFLLEYFDTTDVFRQHRTDLYPYPCDFYIKSIDTYVEFQGSWCHGGEPYDPDNSEHQKLINKWDRKDTAYFRHAKDTWVRRDPEKRQTAKDNNLNWLEFFTLEEAKEYLEQNYSKKQ